MLQSRYGVWLNEFKDFYTELGIPITDVEAQTNLLYQNELRAKRKDLLSFSLYMKNNTIRAPNVLILEIPKNEQNSNDNYTMIINKLHIFSLMGQNTLYDRFIFNIPGVSSDHKIRKLIQDVLDKEGISSKFFTIKLHTSKFVPLQDLYDYDEQKWKIVNF